MILLPIGHEHTTVRRLPWVTFGLMAACLAVLLATRYAPIAGGPEEVFARFGLVPNATQPLALGTYLFLHAGWIHLLGNLLILFLAGPPIEDRWGRPLFGLFYLCAGLASGLFYVLMTPGSAVPMIGASGAVAAVLGACLVRYWRSRIHFFYFLFFLPRSFRGTFWAPAWLMLPLWFGSEVFEAALADHLGARTGVAYWAHVGGFAFGAAVAWAVARLQLEERFLDGAIERKITVADNPVIEEAMDARIHGDPHRAFGLLEEAARDRPDDPDVVLAFWELACELRTPERAAPAVLQIVRQQLAGGDAQLAASTWCELVERVPSARAEPGLLVRLAPLLAAREQPRQAALALRHAVAGALTPGLALRIAELARPLDPGVALAAARRALEAPDVHEARRGKIEALVAELEASGARAPEPEPLLRRDRAGEQEIEAESAREEVSYQERLLDVDEDPDPVSASVSASPPPVPEPGPHLELDPGGGLVASAQGDDLSPHPAVAQVTRDTMPFFPGVKAVEAVPLELSDEGVALERSGGAQGLLPYGKIDAVAVAAVDGLGSRPVLLLDLAINWTRRSGSPLQLVRLRSDRFDVRRLAPAAQRATEAFRSLVEHILARCQAAPLPDADGVRGRPFRRFESLEAYEREILQVTG